MKDVSLFHKFIRGNIMKIPASAAGKTVELNIQRGKKTDNHIVLWVGVKTDKVTGEMKGQLQGVRNDTLGKKIMNFFKGRHIATSKDLVKHCMNQGMTKEQALQALDKVTMDGGKGYSVKSYSEKVDEFTTQQREQRQAQKNFSQTDGKFLSQDVFDRREIDLSAALKEPVRSFVFKA
jgi:hypothetical protein